LSVTPTGIQQIRYKKQKKKFWHGDQAGS